MTPESGDEDVFLVPVGEDLVLAVPADEAVGIDGGEPLDLGGLVEAVGPLVGAALKGRGVRGAALYKMSPESRKMFEHARLNVVGSYFRGVLRNQDGQITHQVQLREVQPAAAPTSFDPVAAVQMAAIQAQLSRIEDTLSDLTRIVHDTAA